MGNILKAFGPDDEDNIKQEPKKYQNKNNDSFNISITSDKYDKQEYITREINPNSSMYITPDNDKQEYITSDNVNDSMYIDDKEEYITPDNDNKEFIIHNPNNKYANNEFNKYIKYKEKYLMMKNN